MCRGNWRSTNRSCSPTQHLLSALALIALTALVTSGCGGGGGGIPGFSQGGDQFTPPENAMSTQQQTSTLATATVRGWLSNPQDISSDLLEPPIMLDSVENLFSFLGLTSQPSPPRPAGARSLVVQMTKAWLSGKLALRARAAQIIDWTDPQTGVHWTGTYEETATTHVLHATGTAQGTSLKVDLEEQLPATAFNLSLHLSGTAAADVQVENNTYAGKADIWVSYSVSAAPGQAKVSGSEGLEWSIPQGNDWLAVQRVVVQSELTLTLVAGVFTADLGGELTYAGWVGGGVFWIHVKGDVTASGPDNASDWDAIVGYWDGTASNGMSAHVEFAQDGSVSGWVKSASGETMATVLGNIHTQITFTYKDGTTDTITLF